MTDVVRRTPEETLNAALKEVNDAIECLVIMTSEDGSILTLGSTSILSTRLGMLEMAKALIVKDIERSTK